MASEPTVILITGAAKRLGLAQARRLAARGHGIAVHFNASAEEAAAAVSELLDAGAEAASFQANLREVGEARRLIDDVVNHFGRLDVLVNNAAIYYATPLPEVEQDDFDAFMNVNARGPFFAAQAAARVMMKQEDGGCIVNIIDSLHDRPKARFVPYGMSKAALAAMTRGMAAAFAPKIRVNGVAPGPVLLPQDYRKIDGEKSVQATLLKRVGTPEDIADAVEFLIYRANYITGHILYVDGGRSSL